MSKYIVTGGAGFIGSSIVNHLLRENHEVVVIDDFSTGDLKNLEKNDNLTVLKIDISNWLEIVRHLRYFKNVDGLFHLAASARIQPSIQNPIRTHEVNVNGTLNVLEMMVLMDIKKIIYSSSSSVYGLKNESPLHEDMQTDCLNCYSASKRIGEVYCQSYGNMYGIKNLSLRYFNVYGQKSPLTGQYAPVIGLFFRQTIQENKPMTIVGNGNQMRDFTYVGDVVDANILAMKKANDKNAGNIINIGSGNSYSINNVALMIGKTLNIEPANMKKIPARPGEADYTKANIEKANKILKWSPKVNLKKGLEILSVYYRDTLKG